MKRLRTRADVTEDLANIYAWIAERNPRAARDFLIAVDDTFKEIGRNPGVGWSHSWRDARLQGMRSWRVKGYREFLVFCREEGAFVEVFGVLRGSRLLHRVLRER